MNQPMIVNIQKYSLHDGDGIRTTVFFKGCMLNCWWCHNPESQRYGKELMFDREKCSGCGYCSKHCPQDAITISARGFAVTDKETCRLCAACLDYCPAGNREIVGREYTVEELVRIISQDARFYEDSGGGVTLSGGEVMTQDMDYLEKLCRRLKEKDYHIAVDTCGYAPTENYKRLLPYVDIFLYDIKTLDDEIHKKYMGQSNARILSNLEFLADHGAAINIRIPVVEPVNSSEAAMGEVIRYLKRRIGSVAVNLLPYHSTGSSKYAKLGREYPARELKVPDSTQMERLKAMFEAEGFHHVKIGG